MLLTEISIDDLEILEKLRLERLSQLFISSLTYCLVYIDVENVFTIYCPSSEIVDELLGDLGDLCHYAWLILGCRTISLYFCQEEIVCVDTWVTL